MSHTNSTTNYALPQFLTSDKPAWLTDINNAFSDIDTAVYAAKSKADTAFTDAGNAQTDATTAINNAAAADAKGSGALASIEVAFDPTTIYAVGARVIYNSLLYRCIVAVVTPGPWTGSDNWERITIDNLISTVDSKVGSLSSLSTTDKTSIVNAINEVNGAALKVSELRIVNEYKNTNANGTIDSNTFVEGAIPLSRTILSAYSPDGYLIKIGYYSSRYTFDVYDSSFQLLRNTPINITVVAVNGLS